MRVIKVYEVIRCLKPLGSSVQHLAIAADADLASLVALASSMSRHHVNVLEHNAVEAVIACGTHLELLFEVPKAEFTLVVVVFDVTRTHYTTLNTLIAANNTISISTSTAQTTSA
jgi:hypothetical protein